MTQKAANQDNEIRTLTKGDYFGEQVDNDDDDDEDGGDDDGGDDDGGDKWCCKSWMVIELYKYGDL